ncbi:uncharacterized protein PV09_08487 [Verruconis gallopava]|uniref:Uncharacterized protein n=1 Tax=Verruconis gallopava TaxID=253628 RepID=A0A0D2A025_9PEZI|nr:uncharacterized protein PV09_08487 [Verruconis gallopava]KIV99977.1 hypothetical protein PV09_08487 [Verruconis gallopava]
MSADEGVLGAVGTSELTDVIDEQERVLTRTEWSAAEDELAVQLVGRVPPSFDAPGPHYFNLLKRWLNTAM